MAWTWPKFESSNQKLNVMVMECESSRRVKAISPLSWVKAVRLESSSRAAHANRLATRKIKAYTYLANQGFETFLNWLYHEESLDTSHLWLLLLLSPVSIFYLIFNKSMQHGVHEWITEKKNMIHTLQSISSNLLPCTAMHQKTKWKFITFI